MTLEIKLFIIRFYNLCSTHQKKEPILQMERKLRTSPTYQILIVNSQEVAEVNSFTILDTSSLAPKKQMSVPKPSVSGIFYP